jgi:tRNA dimethylallyltransferase
VTLPPLLVIAGPTATGKTGLSIRVARTLIDRGIPTEIISADSRQVFRGLDIGTAKATPAEREGVPHHGIDLVDPDEPFSVAAFTTHARAALDEIARAGGLAILVGGSGLYLRAVARGLDTETLPSDPDVRSRLEQDLASEGLESLVARLIGLAPTRAAAVDLRNPRRVVRALEVAELTGDAALPPSRGYPGPVAWIGLRLEPATHREWIVARARTQFDSGLVDEAAALRERYDPALPAFSAIGYREAWSVLDGEATIEEAIASDAQRNIAFAKRQGTWFRAEPDVTWLDASHASDEQTGAVATRLVAERGAPAART